MTNININHFITHFETTNNKTNSLTSNNKIQFQNTTTHLTLMAKKKKRENLKKIKAGIVLPESFFSHEAQWKKLSPEKIPSTCTNHNRQHNKLLPDWKFCWAKIWFRRKDKRQRHVYCGGGVLKLVSAENLARKFSRLLSVECWNWG